MALEIFENLSKSSKIVPKTLYGGGFRRFGSVWGDLGASLSILAASWERLGAILGPSWERLGQS